MARFTCWITPADGISRSYALIAFDLSDARREALLLAKALYGERFSFSVREAA